MTPTPTTQPPEPLIEVKETRDDLAVAVAGELVHRILEAQADGRVPHLALTGGSVADAVHQELTRLSEESEIGHEVDWARVVFWWGDERFVEPASPDRNERQAREAFLDRVDVDPANVHPMPSTESADSAEAGAAAYADELRAHGTGTFEVVMLGLGPDAHVASLFPGFPQLDSDEIAVAVHDSPKPPPDRISLTLPCLNRARSVWFIVSGEEKADAVALALADGTDVHDAPAAGVAGEHETIWFLDRAAASKL
jgi:6-phosphogluconolactonase